MVKKKLVILTLLVMALILFTGNGTVFADTAGTAGIEPVSPEEFAGKLSETTENIYKSLLPLVDSAAKVALVVAGVVALFFLFGGVTILKRVLGAIMAVGIALILFHGAPHIIALIKGFITTS